MRKFLKYAIIDIFIASIILVVFAFFHHVLPSIKAVQAASLMPSPNPVIITSEPIISVNDDNDINDKTEWQIKFADKFSDEIVRTDSSYKSPNISIEIDTVIRDDLVSNPVKYYVADIYISSIDCLKTYLAHGSYTYFDHQNVLEMDETVNALLSIGGDYATYQNNAFLIRNGNLLYECDKTWGNLCVLYNDGVMQCYEGYKYNHDEIISNGAWQVWDFGPNLLDENGEMYAHYMASSYVSMSNPRSSIGYFEPGHYCFIVVDGRQEDSMGVYLNELAQIYHELGCKQAYNLDGGGSAVMLFNHQPYSNQSSPDRKLGDIIYIAEPN